MSSQAVRLKLLRGETAVFWRPVHGGGMIPSFSGRLSFAAAEGSESCQLSLEESYTPPLGLAGAARHRYASIKTDPAYRERWGSS